MIKELNNQEMVDICGGKAKYADFVWSGTGNPVVYAAEAAYNAGVAVYNGGVWVWNQIFD